MPKTSGGSEPANGSPGTSAVGKRPATVSSAEWKALVERLAPVIERMQSACMILDVESRIVAWNEVARLLFGRESSEVLGTSPGGSLVSREAWLDFEAIYRQAGTAGLSTSAVLEHELGTGKRIVCEWRMAALTRPDGSVAGYTAMASERGYSARAEDAGEESMSPPAWEAVFDQTPVPTILLTAEGVIWRANQAAKQFLERQGPTIEGRTL
ncbi:MAG: PAS domain-containing protein, partial [Verrucomicrobiales bacterium]|nr:PAS domain-containing protein [Verrucomicrobiales bacterium]